MISQEVIKDILECAVQAPSGENVQPWRFSVGEDTISVFNIPENDRSLYNFRQRVSYMANGTVVQNIAIAASHFGLKPFITLIPDQNDPNHIADVFLKEITGSVEDPLYSFLEKRCTNRKFYKKDNIPTETLQEILHAGESIDNIKIAFTTNSKDIERLAAVASISDRLLLENKEMHDYFFSHLYWTLKESLARRAGFYIEVLELLPPAKILFRLFKYWGIVRLLNLVGISKIGAKENTKIYASASAMGIIIIPDETQRSFINSGMAFQKLWLTATSKNISLQPLTSILFFNQSVRAGEAKQFSDDHKDLIMKGYEEVQSVFNIQDKTIVMMFRIGYADSPTATSLKLPPIIINK